MNDQPVLVKKLAAKVAETLRDQKLLADSTDVKESNIQKSAVTEYLKFSQDPQVPTGIKYTVLHYLACKQGYYNDPREQAEMLGIVAETMNTLAPAQAVQGIRDLRQRYPLLYQLDPSSFDRAESSAVEFISRLPINQQSKTIADSKGSALQPRSLPPLVPTIPPANVQEPQTPLPIAISSGPSSISPVNVPPNYSDPSTSNNKGALLLGSGIIAGAMIFSAAILASRQSQHETASSPTLNPTLPSPTASIASSSTAQNPPENVISEYYQNINSRQYQVAWNKLPENLRNSPEVHPNGYQSFVDFFDQLSGVQVNNLAVSDRTDYSAIVNADLVCQSKKGNSSLLFLRFSLYRNDINQQWQISKVRLNPKRQSACGI